MKHFYKLFSFPEKAGVLLKSMTLLVVFLFGNLQSTNAQVGAYGFSQSSGTFTPIVGTNLGTATGNASATNLNSAVYPVTLPFSFIFNGTSYSALNVSTNGFVTFGATAPATTTTTPISGTVAYDGAISAWGRDISSFFNVAGTTGSISWETTGTAPNREVTIQWRNFRTNSATAVTTVFSFSFQIKLQETSNIIKIVYDSGSYLIGSTAVDLTAQIGLRGSTNADFKNRLNDDTVSFTNSTQGIANGSTQAFSTVDAIPGMPTAGLTYTFTPPTCFPPTNVLVNNILTTSANVSWTAPTSAPANGYDVYYSTSSAPPLNSVTPQYTGVTGVSQVITGLTQATVYYVWVRSVCSPSNVSEWSLLATFPSGCDPVATMFENFDSYDTGNIVPICWARIVGASNTAQSISSTSPASGTRHILQTTSTAANATIVVLPQFSNVNAGTHWLRFKARVASATGSLDVGYVTNITDATTFVNIQTINILNTSYAAQDSEYKVIVPNTVPANARLAIRNSGTSTIGHFYDDVYWEAKPSCISPTNISISNISPTSAQVQWTASVTPPANGYDIYYSTSDTPPTSSTSPLLTVNTGLFGVISPLTPVTTYYVWVRSRCSTTDFSAWSTQIVTFNSLCQPPTITATTGATVCPNNPATLTATSTGALKWHDAPTAGNVVGTGSSFTTPSLTATTPYYVSAANTTMGYVGLPAPISITGNSGVNSLGLIFDAIRQMTIETVDIYPLHATNTSGTVTIDLKDAANVTLQTVTVNVTVSPSGALNTVSLNFLVPAGTGYKLVVTGKSTTITSFLRESDTANFSYPYVFPGVCTITGTTTANFYYYLYNWKVSSICESARTMVTATVDSNCLSTSETDKKKNINVYPNPFSDVINIDRPELVKSIQITDLSGKLVRNNIKAESILRLNDLTAGMYILQLDMKDGSKQTIKIIKK
ncbi:hypothetical protein CHRY9390_01728 [Chryseobacterium aquaeductus]|uniref:Fibronectin type-III domain-containing protein n=1 Tax=Chryseobacterium aquaeductus TaxID=2675056 RepID=A0A9N8QUM4_9FLAO|nr:fibronectin type III domain-containing protein [Chryseobacterium aquaeductus]CAA7331048.1 hypothetical protein CHRY9390_01728 [Chryseobacterium potabilaquae]CAD7807865.1 hypothetical protein CHRY9390_01728 [Chryseobacterium aquaeductus]